MKIRVYHDQYMIALPSWLIEFLGINEDDDFSVHTKDGNRNMIILLRENLK